MNGWIKISRHICDWEWFDNPLMVKAWIWMLATANYEDKKWQGVDIQRGQFITSLSKMSEALKITVRQARTILNDMQKTHEVTLECTNKYTIVTICKFEDYQCDEYDERQVCRQAERQAERQANDTQSDNNIRIKNIKKDNISKDISSKESSGPYGEAHFLADLESLNIHRQTALDWFACRKLKKLPFTRSAFEATKRELLKITDKTPQELIQFAADEGWGGFKAEYWLNAQIRIQQNQNGPNNRNTSSGKEILGNGVYESTL